jgi:hypothetical protein
MCSSITRRSRIGVVGMHMRLAIAVVLLAACSSKPSAPKRLIDRAAQIETELSDGSFELAVAAVMKDPVENLQYRRQPLKYPVEPVVERCGKELVRAIYNPYQDLLVLGVAADDTAGEDTRTIWFDNKKVWTNPRKAAPPTDMGNGMALILDKPIEEELVDNSEALRSLSTSFATWFPADKDVAYDLRFTTQANAMVGASSFRVEKREHRGWKLSMHPFSPKMREEIIAHGASIDRLTAELFVLERYTADMLEMKNYPDDAKIAPVLLHLEKVKARAEALLAAAKDIPHAKYRVSLTHTPACETTAANP